MSSSRLKASDRPSGPGISRHVDVACVVNSATSGQSLHAGVEVVRLTNVRLEARVIRPKRADVGIRQNRTCAPTLLVSARLAVWLFGCLAIIISNVRQPGPHWGTSFNAAEKLQRAIMNNARKSGKHATSHQPCVHIDLEHPDRTYTTSDKLSGTVQVTVTSPTAINSVHIHLLGIARTRIIRPMMIVGKSDDSRGYHEFLNVAQPALQHCLPPDQKLRPGQAYSFPFHFTVPKRLLPQVCSEHTEHSDIQDSHLALPPSMDNRGLATSDVLEDISSRPANVHYCICATVTERSGSYDQWKSSILAKQVQHVRIVPTASNSPGPWPYHPGNMPFEICYWKRKTLRRKLAAGVLGTVVVEAEQPQPLRLAQILNSSSTLVFNTSELGLSLLFEPSSRRDTVPVVKKVTSKLKVHTCFTARPEYDLPGLRRPMCDADAKRVTESIDLGTHIVDNTSWRSGLDTHQAESSGAPPPYDGQTNGLGCPYVLHGNIRPRLAHQKLRESRVSRLAVPLCCFAITKPLVPTFYSCVVSQVYALSLSILFKGTGYSSAVNLSIPVEVLARKATERACKGSHFPLTSFDQAVSTVDSNHVDDAESCPAYSFAK